MNDELPAFKPIKFKNDKWQEIKELADELADERGSNVSMPDAVAEAIKFYRENRPKPAGAGVRL